MKFLSSHWWTIAPEDFGSAPSLGPIDAKLEGYLFLDEGKRPRFGFDEPAFLKLVRSNSLYDDRDAWLRELLSNADDATRIRVFLEEFATSDAEPKESEDSSRDPMEVLEPTFRKYPIDITIEKEIGSADSHGREKNEATINVVIKDRGTGISEQDLRYILMIGSSAKNYERRSVVNKMPEYLKPTGNFGIGFQSIFMVADRVQITTTDFRTRKKLRIEMIRSSKIIGSEQDTKSQVAGVYIRPLDNGELKSRGGTTIEFSFPVQSVSYESPVGEYSEDSSAELDPVIQDLQNAEVEKLKQIVSSTGQRLRTPVNLNGEALANDVDSSIEHVFYSRTQHCLFKFRPNNRSDNTVELMYRGMPIRRHSLARLELLNLCLDLQFGNASEVLTASRDTLTPDGVKIVQDKLAKGLAEIFPEYIKALKK